MASGDILVIPAQAAGFYSFTGSIVKNGNNTLSIPEGMINIGGNSFGYLIQANNAFDPYLSTNRDSSFSAVTLGDDVYIYACQSNTGIAKLVCSKNATSPTGYTALNSRKIGGFHAGRTRPITSRFDAAFVPTVGIVPNSVWDLGHRPKCSPEGMAEFQPGLWGSIYLCSVVSGAWPSPVFGSRYNVTPVRSTGGYNELDLHRGLHAAGMREPTFEEWLMMSYGAPQGADANNDTAWTAASNTGPCNTGAVAKSVSCANFVDTVGSLWERLAHHFDAVGTYAWASDVVNTGQDAAFARGQVIHSGWRSAVAGGDWGEGTRGGSRTLHLSASPWAANGSVGARGVSESL